MFGIHNGIQIFVYIEQRVMKLFSPSGPTPQVLAKDLVRTRNYVTKFIEFRSHLQGVGLKLETVRSHEAMAGAMKDVTKAMVSLNKQVNTKRDAAQLRLLIRHRLSTTLPKLARIDCLLESELLHRRSYANDQMS